MRRFGYQSGEVTSRRQSAGGSGRRLGRQRCPAGGSRAAAASYARRLRAPWSTGSAAMRRARWMVGPRLLSKPSLPWAGWARTAGASCRLGPYLCYGFRARRLRGRSGLRGSFNRPTSWMGASGTWTALYLTAIVSTFVPSGLPLWLFPGRASWWRAARGGLRTGAKPRLRLKRGRFSWLSPSAHVRPTCGRTALPCSALPKRGWPVLRKPTALSRVCGP